MADIHAYGEVHIEQGPILESVGRGICTVTGTKGIERERLTFRGQAAHAGTMPMEMRRDSFRAASRFALEIADIGARHEGVTTVGVAQCWPGVVTAVAGETRIAMDMRHIDATALQAMFDDAHDAAQRPARLSVSSTTRAYGEVADEFRREAAHRAAHRPALSVIAEGRSPTQRSHTAKKQSSNKAAKLLK